MRTLPIFVLIATVTFLYRAEAGPSVGRKAAQKYFRQSKRAVAHAPMNHYLSLHYGGYSESVAYVWEAPKKQSNIGRSSMGVTYRIGEWVNSMDLLLRLDFNSYRVVDEAPFKMSVVPLVTFPDISSGFPLYFGLGAGVGVFFKQVENESNVSIDYQLVAGARFLNIFENTGFFVETGMKNHIHILSDGQFNGSFLTGGAIFTF